MKLLLIMLTATMLLAKTTVISTTPIVKTTDKIDVICVDGYKYLVVYSHSYAKGTAVTQMYRENFERYGNPQPIKCKQ